nr:MAG TPA: YsxB-like protein [Caudoviricetes sp.]
MIQVIYNEVEDAMILRAEGHAGFAPKGQDIVCAAVSVLMQTLACSVGTCMCNEGKRFSVVCKKSNDNIAKFELVTDGLALLQREYPENVRYINATEKKTKALELQLFAEGGDGSGAGETSQSAGADSSPSRGALGRTENAALDEQGSTDSKAEGSGSENGEGEAGEEAKKPSPAERRRAFGQMMSGEYKDLADEMMQNAVQIAAQNLEASPEMRGLLEAIAEKYGTDATDLTALTDAIRNGVVKDDAYFEKIAMEKGISVKTAREMDKLETQNKRLTAQQQAAQQMQKAAAERARIAQIQARWDAEAEALQAKYPDFDREEVLANPEVEKMMRAGCSMEAAYRAAYFDRLMARQTAATAQQTEQGVLNRVQQRASRPAENGTRPGGAVQTHLDVEHMSRKDREALERRVLRGEIITL